MIADNLANPCSLLELLVVLPQNCLPLPVFSLSSRPFFLKFEERGREIFSTHRDPYYLPSYLSACFGSFFPSVSPRDPFSVQRILHCAYVHLFFRFRQTLPRYPLHRFLQETRPRFFFLPDGLSTRHGNRKLEVPLILLFFCSRLRFSLHSPFSTFSTFKTETPLPSCRPFPFPDVLSILFPFFHHRTFFCQLIDRVAKRAFPPVFCPFYTSRYIIVIPRR